MALAVAASPAVPMSALVGVRVIAFAAALLGVSPIAAAASSDERVCPECIQRNDTNLARELTVRRARSASRAGEWNEAAELWRDALLMDGRDAAHWMALGEALSRAERYLEAVAAYQRAVQVDARMSRDGTWKVARAYAQMGNERQTVRWLEQALRQGVQPADLWREEVFERYRSEPRLRVQQKRQVDRREPRSARESARSI
jgi:tetratricopeptide (TPR) repeat protein